MTLSERYELWLEYHDVAQVYWDAGDVEACESLMDQAYALWMHWTDR